LPTNEVYRSSFHGIERFSGIWLNPNVCGLLAATSLIFCIAELLRLGLPWECGFVRGFIWRIIVLSNAVTSGVLLAATWSRGAWVATFVGIVFFVFHSCWSSRIDWTNRLRKLLIVGLFVAVLIAGAVVADRPGMLIKLQDRALSTVDWNDRSQGNRLLAWKTLIEITSQNPLVGVPFSLHETIHRCKLKRYGIADPQAIYTNCHLRIAAGLGVFGFAIYFFILVMGVGSGVASRNLLCYKSSMYCAIVILLVIGLWLSQGLFELAAGIHFWIMLFACELRGGITRIGRFEHCDDG
jgi:vacuolar-type H+-ATPase subunit I/STV1